MNGVRATRCLFHSQYFIAPSYIKRISELIGKFNMDGVVKIKAPARYYLDGDEASIREFIKSLNVRSQWTAATLMR